MSADNFASNSSPSTDATLSASACWMNGSKSPDAIASDNVMRSTADLPHDHIIDVGIARAVEALQDAGVETFESCQGGPGHAFPEPTVRFHGSHSEGHRALAAAMDAGLDVGALRRVWDVIDGEPSGPCWEMTFANQGGRAA
jgi:hypothetical protein